LSIGRLGVVTSVGLNVGQTMGSILTGVSRPKEVSISDRDGEPLRVCAVPMSAGLGDGLARLSAMARVALAECTGGEDVEPLPLVLCCPPHDALSFDSGALVRTLVQTGAVDATCTRLIAVGGHAAIGSALLEAAKILAGGQRRACLVGAVDTMLNVDRLARLMAADRIVSDRTPDGFIPGEGAAFLRVSLAYGGGGVEIAGVGVTTEEATGDSGKVTGRAQANAARSAMAAAGGRVDEVSLFAADLTGERHRFDSARRKVRHSSASASACRSARLAARWALSP
jgi:3-oxoacyl-[acyl-carrier-protein] synthase-1